MKVFKYPAVRILHAGLDPTGQICVWCVVFDESHPHLQDNFLRVVVAGTGHDVGGKFQTTDHISSFVEGPFVWHVFAQIRDPHERYGL